MPISHLRGRLTSTFLERTTGFEPATLTLANGADDAL